MSFSFKNPLLSVIVPVFNSERYLKRCLDSVAAQSYKNIELVVIDDGSTDSSPEMLDQYAAASSLNMIVHHQPNAGAAHARNAGIEISSGDYITFLDNDDWLDQDFCCKLVQEALSSGADVVCSGYRRPDDRGVTGLEVVTHPNEEWAKYIVGAAWAKIYRAAFVKDGGYSFLDTNIDEDLYFTIPIIEQANRVSVLPYCGYNWFNNSGSVSNTSQKTSSGLMFEETITAILMECKRRGIPISAELEHYFIRLVVWFLLYTCRGDGSKTSLHNLRYYKCWLDKYIPNWRHDSYAQVGHPTGDGVSNRVAVWMFAKHPALFRIALAIYRKVSF